MTATATTVDVAAHEFDAAKARKLIREAVRKEHFYVGAVAWSIENENGATILALAADYTQKHGGKASNPDVVRLRALLRKVPVAEGEQPWTIKERKGAWSLERAKARTTSSKKNALVDKLRKLVNAEGFDEVEAALAALKAEAEKKAA